MAPLYTRFLLDVGATIQVIAAGIAVRRALSPCVCIEGKTVGMLKTDSPVGGANFLLGRSYGKFRMGG
jgi:hypothetical protein